MAKQIKIKMQDGTWKMALYIDGIFIEWLKVLTIEEKITAYAFKG